MPENQKKTPYSRITKRNPDSKPNSDTTARYVRKWPGNRNFRTHLYCAVNESDALDSWKAASDMAPLRAVYDKSADILTIST